MAVSDTYVRARIDNTTKERATAALGAMRSEEHTSELQSLMRISYAVFCLKKKKKCRQTCPNPERASITAARLPRSLPTSTRSLHRDRTNPSIPSTSLQNGGSLTRQCTDRQTPILNSH